MSIQAILINKDNEITNTIPMIELVHKLRGDNESMYTLIKTPMFQQNKKLLDDAYKTIGTNLVRIACIQNRLGFFVETK